MHAERHLSPCCDPYQTCDGAVFNPTKKSLDEVNLLLFKKQKARLSFSCTADGHLSPTNYIYLHTHPNTPLASQRNLLCNTKLAADSASLNANVTKSPPFEHIADKV